MNDKKATGSPILRPWRPMRPWTELDDAGISRVAQGILDGTFGSSDISSHERIALGEHAPIPSPDAKDSKALQARNAAEAMVDLRAAGVKKIERTFGEKIEQAERITDQELSNRLANQLSSKRDKLISNMVFSCLSIMPRPLTGGTGFASYASPSFYMLASTGLSAAMGILRADELPLVEDIAIMSPAFLRAAGKAAPVKTFLSCSKCIYDEQQGFGTDEDVIARKMPDAAYSQALVSRMSRITFGLRCRSLSDAVSSQSRGSGTRMLEALMYPIGIGHEELTFMRDVEYDLWSVGRSDTLVARAVQLAVHSIVDGEVPDAYDTLWQCVQVLFPLYAHMVFLDYGEDMADRVAEYDFVGAWSEHGGDTYLEALAAGVPMTDLLA